MPGHGPCARWPLTDFRGWTPPFPRAVRDALRIVAEDPEGDAFLKKWAALEAQYRQPLW